MILLLDTRDAVCRLTFVDGENKYNYEWQSDRNLANGLLGFLKDNLNAKNWGVEDILAIGVFEGPGSFTSLRIGLTVVNTLASSMNIPIIGARGDSWQAEALQKIKAGYDDKIVMPFYGAEANITTPRK